MLVAIRPRQRHPNRTTWIVVTSDQIQTTEDALERELEELLAELQAGEPDPTLDQMGADITDEDLRTTLSCLRDQAIREPERTSVPARRVA